METDDKPPSPLTVGVIGPGAIADERLVPALKRVPGAELWSVCSRSPERALNFATRHGARSPSPAYSDLAAFLADPALQVVLITSTDLMHAPHALAALQAGKHVMVEKPMATSTAEAEQMLAAARAANKKLAVGYHLRFHAGHRLVADLLKRGRIGTPRHMHVRWTMTAPPADWRAAAETGKWWSLGAVGTHALDLVRWLMTPTGGKIVSVQSVLGHNVYGGPHDETAVVSLGLESGATAQVVSSVVFRAPRVVEIFGSAGSIVCLETLGPRGAGSITVCGEQLPFAVEDPYEKELESFLQSIRHGGRVEVDGQDGLDNVTLLERAVAGA